MRLAPILTLPALVAACAAGPSPSQEPQPSPRPVEQCDADGVQEHVGDLATAELGAQLMADTGARVLRWVPPRTAVTMDYRMDRLTVSYDDDMIVTRISCG